MYKDVAGSAAMKFLATRPTMIITTRHPSGVVNAGVFGAYTNLSPTQVGIAVGTGSHTYANIGCTGEFVINVPGADLVGTIGIIASAIPPAQSEVEAAGLTLRKGLVIETASIAECVAAVEFMFDKEVPIGHHSFMVGKVAGGWIQASALDTDGGIDIFKARVFHDFKYPQPVYCLPGEVIRG